jgi:hypothetical protein
VIDVLSVDPEDLAARRRDRGTRAQPHQHARHVRCRVDVQAIFHDGRTWPDAVHQLVLGDKRPGRLGQHLDDLESPPSNRYRRTQNPQFAPGGINLAVTRRVILSSAPCRHDVSL